MKPSEDANEATRHVSLKQMQLKIKLYSVDKKCSRQGNPDAAATADESNPYMLPFQATQKQLLSH